MYRSDEHILTNHEGVNKKTFDRMIRYLFFVDERFQKKVVFPEDTFPLRVQLNCFRHTFILEEDSAPGYGAGSVADLCTELWSVACRNLLMPRHIRLYASIFIET